MNNEMIKFCILFSICSLINVILNTAKTLIMYKRNAFSSANINMITYGFYTVIVVMMAGEMPLELKIILTGLTNWIGTFISVQFLNALEKDKLWLVKMTVNSCHTNNLHKELTTYGIPHSYIENVGKHTVFDCYCATQKDSAFVKEVGQKHKAKFFACKSENLI